MWRTTDSSASNESIASTIEPTISAVIVLRSSGLLSVTEEGLPPSTGETTTS